MDYETILNALYDVWQEHTRPKEPIQTDFQSLYEALCASTPDPDEVLCLACTVASS